MRSNHLPKLTLACSSLWLAAGVSAQTVSFDRDVRPILADKCFQCHGPAKNVRKAHLRLDRADGPEGSYRTRKGVQAIKPGSFAESAIGYRLTTKNINERMPAKSSHKRPLSPEQVDTIRRWVDQGAKYERYWAFVAPKHAKQPQIGNPAWNRSPIDRLVMRKLQEHELEPSPRADARTLIRRLSLDLTGLPPTREDIHAFLADQRPDAYSRLVDRLLAKPQYGEHMARYWLDLVRFADTNGIHHDHYRDMSPFRSWVIRAFNDNLPYDEFVTYQVAGDLFPDPSTDQLVASGFNRLHLIIDRGTALPEESFTRNVIDRVTAFGTTFMGMTLGCAVCHDHKYDPIKQKDFYRFAAFFDNFDGAPETGGRSGSDFRRGLQKPYLELPSAEQAPKLAKLDEKVDQARVRVESIQAELAALKKPKKDDPKKAALDKKLAAARKKLEAAQQSQAKFLMNVPAAMVMRERKEPRETHVLIRGNYERPGKKVERGTPAFLPPLEPKGKLPTRMDLAAWLVSGKHPLTARVAVNRFWQQLFGVGLVKTSEDFGKQGEFPSNRELLDDLSVTFVESGWDIKKLMKHIVMSETYRQSSKAPASAFRMDPDNRLLARGSRFRLDAEVIRDQILATSGLLNPQMYGKSVKPPQPPGIWKAVTLPSSYPRVYVADTGDKIYRRSVYTFWKRGMPPPQMTILNAPSRESCTARRERTNTPLQALLLLDENEYFKAARHLAATTLAGGDGGDAERVSVVYETITSQLPDVEESATLLATLEDLKRTYHANPTLAEQLCKGAELPEGVTPEELAAWTVVVSSIYNLDITKTRE